MTLRLALAVTLAACLIGFAGFAYGIHVGRAQEQAGQSKAALAAKARSDALERQIDTATQRAQVAEQARQTIVREIRHESEKIIERPVYTAVCVDADGVGLLDRAAATANGDGVQPSAGAAGTSAVGPAD